MCLVQLHKSSKSVSYRDMSEYPVPARIVTTAYSRGSSDEKHHKAQVVNAQARRSSEHIPSTAAVHSSPSSSRVHLRAQRRNTMASGGPARASYVSSRGAAYHRSTEKFFYGRDSGEPLLLSTDDMTRPRDRPSSDDLSIRSTSTTGGVSGSVVVSY